VSSSAQSVSPASSSLLRGFLGAFVFLLVFAMYPGTLDPVTPIKWLVVAAGAVIAVALWLVGGPNRRPRLFAIPLAALLVCLAVATLLSDYLWRGVYATSLFVLLFGLYRAAAHAYANPRHLAQLAWCFCIATALASIYGFLQRLGWDPFPWADKAADVYTNIPATFGNPNFAAHAIVVAIPLLLFLSRASAQPIAGFAALFALITFIDAAIPFVPDVAIRTLLGILGVVFGVHTRRYLIGVLLAVLAVHLHFTDQRAGLIALAVAALVVGFAWGTSGVLKQPVIGMFATLTLAALVTAAGFVVVMLYTQWRTGSVFPLDTSLLLRYQSLVSATTMFLENPFTGWGPGVYQVAYAQFWTPFEQNWFAQELRSNAHVHNDLIELAIDGGFIAAALYLTTIVFAIGGGLMMAIQPGDDDRRRAGFLFAAVFVAFFVDGLFGFNLRIPVTAAAFFLLLGALDGHFAPVTPPEALGWRRAVAPALAVLVALAFVVQALAFWSEKTLLDGLRIQRRADSSVAPAPEAVDKLKTASTLAPWSDTALRMLGNIQFDAGQHTDAVPSREQALNRRPVAVIPNVFIARAKNALARQAASKNKPDAAQALLQEAVTHAEDALGLCPVYAPAHEVLGRASITRGFLLARAERTQAELDEQWAKAERHLVAALDNGARNPAELYREVANMRVAQRNLTGAEDALVRAVQADYRDPRAWPFFLEFAHAQERFDRFLDTLYRQIDVVRTADDVNPNVLADMYLWLGNALAHGRGDVDAADDAYRRAIAQGPLSPNAWSSFAHYATQFDRRDLFEQTVRESTAALREVGRDPLPHVIAANALLEGRPGAVYGASQILVAGLTGETPPGITPQQVYGWVLNIAKDQAAALTPDAENYCGAMNNLGVASSIMDQLEDAVTFYARAAECVPEAQAAPLAIRRADVLVRADKMDEALTILREARTAYPGHLDTRWALARTLAKAGNTDAARKEYNALLKQDAIDQSTRDQLQKEMDAL